MKVIELEVLHEWLLPALIAGVILYHFDLMQIMDRITFMILARIYGIVSLSSHKDEIINKLRAESKIYKRKLSNLEKRLNKIVKESNEEQRNKIMKEVEALRREETKSLSTFIEERCNKMMKEVEQVRKAGNDEIVEECKKMIKKRADENDSAYKLFKLSVEERCKKVVMEEANVLFSKYVEEGNKDKDVVIRRADLEEFARQLSEFVEERCNKMKKDVEVVRRADLDEIAKRVLQFVEEGCNKAMRRRVHEEERLSKQNDLVDNNVTQKEEHEHEHEHEDEHEHEEEFPEDYHVIDKENEQLAA